MRSPLYSASEMRRQQLKRGESWRRSRGLCARSCGTAKERAATHRSRRCNSRCRDTSWPRVSRSVANPDHVGETLGIDATKQLDGDVDVSIGSAWYNRRGKIVALNDSQSVAAPAKPNTEVGLGREPHFVGVNSHQQENIGRTAARPANSE